MKKRIYYLHSRLKKLGIKVESRNKCIFLPYNDKVSLTNKYVRILKEDYNYSVQLEII